MNSLKLFLLLFSCHLLPIILAGTSILAQKSRFPISQNRVPSNRRISAAWIQKNCAGGKENYPPKNKFVKRESSMSDSDSSSSSDDSSGGDSSSGNKNMMTTLKGLLKRIPQTNFYSSIPNAVGVVGQGFSVLEKISIALGTPLPYWIGSLPIVVFGIALIFIPDLTTLNLPGFYPSGAGEGDPLAAFPPFPNLDGLPDIDLSLSPDNVPPRIIPPTNSQGSETLLDSPPSSLNAPSIQMEDEEDSPTNPESFQAPRRRIGGGPRGGEWKAGNINTQQMIPQNYHYYKPPVIITSKPV